MTFLLEFSAAGFYKIKNRLFASTRTALIQLNGRSVQEEEPSEKKTNGK